MTSPGSAAANRRSARRVRLGLVLLASLLLHLAALDWATGLIGLPSPVARKEPVMVTELLPPPRKQPIAPPRPKAAPVPPHKAPPRRSSHPKPAHPPATPARSAPTAVQPPSEPVSDTLAGAVAAARAGGDTGYVDHAPPLPASPGPSYKFNPPPPAELDYDVFAWRDQEKWYGSGKFRWHAADGRYRIDGEASITFFFKITVLNFHSDGAINDYGIAPVLYTEQPFHKPVNSTHFRRAPSGIGGTIGFSASDATFPYDVGTQDRASVIWQLAGIGRGAPGQFVPGAHLDVNVAGTRDAETWQIEVAGLEQIETGFSKLQAWHLVRVPRAGSGDQKIDIWLAPGHDWYPARVRYTYPNGDYLDLSLSDLKPDAPQAVAPE